MSRLFAGKDLGSHLYTKMLLWREEDASGEWLERGARNRGEGI